MTDQPTLETIAEQIRQAEASHEWIPPIREQVTALDVGMAYEIQQLNTNYHIQQGRELCGRKIGLTSPVVQKQIGVNEPDYGMLFKDMEFRDGDTIPWSRLQQPKIEAEIAVVLANDLPNRPIENSELESAIDYCVAAFEIPGSRIADWNIRITDTVADNASSGVYVLANERRTANQIDWRLCGMVIEHKGQPVSTGCGAACLGHPLNAAVWLANKMVELNAPLKAGDLLLTGALGPMIQVAPGQTYRTKISTVGELTVSISGEGS